MRASVGVFVVKGTRDRGRKAGTVGVGDVDVFALRRMKPIEDDFVPSDDQRGLKQPTDVGSEIGPPQPGIRIFRSPLPSE